MKRLPTDALAKKVNHNLPVGSFVFVSVKNLPFLAGVGLLTY